MERSLIFPMPSVAVLPDRKVLTENSGWLKCTDIRIFAVDGPYDEGWASDSTNAAKRRRVGFKSRHRAGMNRESFCQSYEEGIILF
jgi:hypothetical protein